MHVSQTTKDKLTSEFQAICNHARTLLEATSGEIDDKTDEARKKLQDSLDAVKGKYNFYEEQFAEGFDTTKRLVHEKPFHALGIALGVGLLLGWLLSGRKGQ
jgi:ElaB/YqjD/DUF883 family membrane-anchored ribosome-binding protein